MFDVVTEHLARIRGQLTAEYATTCILMSVMSFDDSFELAKDALRGLLGAPSETVDPDVGNWLHEQIVAPLKSERDRKTALEAYEDSLRYHISLLEKMENRTPSEDSDLHEEISRLLRNTDFVSRAG